jgi:hypothetical protein
VANRKTKTDRPWKKKSGKRRPRASRTFERSSVVVKSENAEVASSEIREPLTTELDVLQRLHALSMELISGGEIDAFFERMLDTAVAIMD